MRKNEILLLTITGVVWLVTLGGRSFVGLVYYQFYTALQLMHVFAQYRPFRIPFTTSLLVLISLLMSKKFFFSRQIKLMTAFFGVMCLSRLVNGLDVMGHPYMTLYYKIIFAHLIITGAIDNKEKLKFFIWVLIISNTALAFLTHYLQTFQAYYWMDKNDFGAGLVAAIAFPLIYVFDEPKIINKAELLFYMMILLYGVLVSQSRGAFLALMVVTSLVFFNNFTPKKMLLFFLVGAVLFAKFYPTAIKRYESIMHEAEERTGTGGQRIGAWLTAINMMKDKPIFGIGPGEFPDNFMNYAHQKAREKIGFGHEKINTHSTYFQVGAETGFIGLSIFFFIILTCYKDIIRAIKLCRNDPALSDLQPISIGIGISLTGYLAAGVFLNYGYNVLLYTLIALTVTVNKLTNVATSSEEETYKQDQSFLARLSIGRHVFLRSILLFFSIYYCLQ